MISKQTAERFVWRDACEGWLLLDTDTLHVVQERMPPGTHELRHVHDSVRQFCFVLADEATIDVGSHSEHAGPGAGPLPHDPSRWLTVVCTARQSPEAGRLSLVALGGTRSPAPLLRTFGFSFASGR